MKTHTLALLTAIAIATPLCAADDLMLEVRQVVIRAPELEVIEMMAAPRKTDAEVAARLWQSVKDGRASVVSDVTSAADEHQQFSVNSGRQVWLPSELSQDFDRLYLTPVGFEEHFIGTALECLPVAAAPLAFDGQVQAEWKTRFSPRGPLTVKWPTSWLNVWENDKASDKAVHGWLDWRDLFEESFNGSVRFGGGEPVIIAIMPPADQVWPGERKGRWLDVFLGQINKADQDEALPPKDYAASFPVMRTMLFGIGLNDKEALAIMSARDARDDAALLQKLLARVRQGDARLHLCAASANDSGAPRNLLSARLHDYPTEMPSIPSGWNYMIVGTQWQTDGRDLELHHDLAPPARTVWPLALDVPEAVMWQPRFRRLNIESVQPTANGTHLLSLQHIPEVMHGEGIRSHESVLVFAQHESGVRPEDEFAPNKGGAQPDAEPPPRDYEAEMIVFELPAKEEADWQPADANRWHEPDGKRFHALLDRVKSGDATLAAHVALRFHAGSRAKVSITEDYRTAVEFDPPEKPDTPRMRPTALKSLPVGTSWEIKAHDPAPEDSILLLTHAFDHSTAKPTEPTLQETLAIAAKDKEDYPGAAHHFETWADRDLKLILGQPRCLGTRRPPGVKDEVLHVAFVRVK